jgi:hypothetical protein
LQGDIKFKQGKIAIYCPAYFLIRSGATEGFRGRRPAKSSSLWIRVEAEIVRGDEGPLGTGGETFLQLQQGSRRLATLRDILRRKG